MKVIMDEKEFQEYIEHQRFNLEISELMGRDMKERICVLFDLLTITAGMSREFAFTASQLEQLLEMAKEERPHEPASSGTQKRIHHYDNTRRSKWQRKIKDHQSRSVRRV